MTNPFLDPSYPLDVIGGRTLYGKDVTLRKRGSRTVPPPRPVPNTSGFTIDDLLNRGEPFESTEQREDGLWIGVPIALRAALDHATPTGLVANMPYLIAGKATAAKSHALWKKWYTALSEENVVIDKRGAFTTRGQPVLVVVHGGGILTPERIERAYDEGLTDQNAARYTAAGVKHLLEGRLPSGESIELYDINAVREGNVVNPFGRYGVVLDFATASATASGWHDERQFLENPVVLARAGTPEYLEQYYEKAKDGKGDIGNWHRFADIDPSVAQGRLLFLSINRGGLVGYNNLGYIGRFVGVAPEARGAQ